MLLADRDPNGSGRTSRASNLSMGSHRQQQAGAGPGAKQHDLLSSAPGVASMLRTSTEMGNLGGLAGDSSSMIPRGSRRTGITSRLSTASSRSNASNRTLTHSAWPSSASSRPRRSRDNNVPQYVPDTLSPTVMNIPGSSPLIPRAREPRDGHRSRSMTMANTPDPTFRLSANRSYGSLRTHEQVQRPKSPYRYENRHRGSGYRPTSPEDIAGSHTRPMHGHGQMPSYHAPPHHPGQMRRRTPSDMSMRRDERAHNAGPPRRSRTPVYYGDPHPDIPPVPPLLPHHRLAAQQSHKSRKSAKTSVSSVSMGRRTDSDGPSSEAPTPPTPMGGVSTGPMYYDYSEQFEVEQFAEPERAGVRTGFVHRTKTIFEEQGSAEPSPKTIDVAVVGSIVAPPAAELPDVAELPASPVGRRITRDLIQEGIGPASTTGDVMASGESEETIRNGMEQVSKGDVKDQPTSSTLQPEQTNKNRLSTLSEGGSSIIDSSTLNFAVQYSIPMVTGNGIRVQANNDTGPVNGHDPGTPTEDGMTDLLAGYQHTVTKQDDEGHGQEGGTVDESADKCSNHAPKSSDEQSFKSCTALPDHIERPSKDLDAKSFKSCKGLPEPDPPFKDSDARSFKTCKDTVTPERALDMPPLRLTKMNMVTGEVSVEKLEMAPMERNQQPTTSSEPNMSKISNASHANSKPSSQHVSASKSISSSTESGTQQPPSVPPRDSSSSKEAQRFQAAASFLVRSTKLQRIPRAISSFGRKSVRDETVVAQDTRNTGENIPTPPPMRERPLSGNPTGPVESLFESLKTPEKALVRQEVVTRPQRVDTAAPQDRMTPKNRALTETPGLKGAVAVHQRSLSTPSPIVPEPSSVYSPENISSAKSRVHSSPVPIPKTPEHNRRDSQTTTHLVWRGRNPSNIPSAHGGETLGIRGGNSRDETTTDLRLSTYKHPMSRLPNVAEEPHEDSSLDMSASNFKHSSVGFPGGGQSGARGSEDDAAVAGKNAPVESHQKGALAQTHGLPSMNFSQLNLLEGLNEFVESCSNRSSLNGALDDGVAPSPEEIRERCQSVLKRLEELKESGDATESGAMNPQAIIAELQKVLIPHMDDLSQQLSELLSSYGWKAIVAEAEKFPEEEAIEKHAMAEISEVAPATKRSSARLRPLPGSPQLQVVEDAVYEEITSKEKGKASRPGNGGAQLTEKDLGEIGAAKGRSWSVAHARTSDKAPLAELEAPSLGLPRTQSLSVGHNNLRDSQDTRLSARSPQSPGSTQTATETRPWNSDKNYPWTATDASVDISLPQAAAAKHSPRAGPSHLRNRLSDASSASGTFTPDGTPAGTMPMPGSDDSFTHARRQGDQRYSLEARSTNPPGLNLPAQPGFDASGYLTGPVNVHGEDRSHGAGERYPTSALTLPTDSHLTGGTSLSHLTVNSDEEPHRPPPRKSLFGLRRCIKAPSGKSRSACAPDDLESAFVDDSTQGGVAKANRLTFSNAQGMTKVEYHRNLLCDRIKSWCHKGGQFFRSLFGRNSSSPAQQQRPSQSAAPSNDRPHGVTHPDSRYHSPLEANGCYRETGAAPSPNGF